MMSSELPKIYSPFIKAKANVSTIMRDVIFALIPLILISYLAYGFVPIILLCVAIGISLLTEFVSALIFQRKKDTIRDGSAIITAILLVFTLAPFTPWYVVAFGSAMAVLFGKILWGGLGRNIFNPALVGREFMVVFFPAVMASRDIWYNKDAVNFSSFDFFSSLGNSEFAAYLNGLIFKPSGAVGEYSVLFIVLGGLFLLYRRRISWHIPFGILVTFFLLLHLITFKDIRFSLGGVLLGAVFMATDMPSSASSKAGKLYYGVMIGVSAVLFLVNDVRYEYMSYSILIVNGFSLLIDKVFRPVVWAEKTNWKKRLLQSVLLTVVIIAMSYAIALLHKEDLISYLIYVYIVFIIVRFGYLYKKKVAFN